jgi:adenylylsulfate kinase
MPIGHGGTSAMEREAGFTLWLTGVPGVGKTTLARGFQQCCAHANRASEVLDGDEFRETFDRELGFSSADRDRHVLRLGHIARLLSRNNVVAIVAAVSPGDQRRPR